MANTELTGKFKGWSKKYESSDVIIVGGGPAGLMAALELAKLDLKTLVIEKNEHAGGQLWSSDFLIHASGSAGKIKDILDEIKIPYKKGKGGLSVAGGPNLSSKLISAVYDAGVRILNMAEFKDLILTDEKAAGVVVNWAPRLSLKAKTAAGVSIALKSHMVIDATGVDARVCRILAEKGAIKPEKYRQADLYSSEKLLVEKTGNIYPGLAAAGMAVATLYEIPHGGLTLCSLLLSGRKAADEAMIFLSDNFLVTRKNNN